MAAVEAMSWRLATASCGALVASGVSATPRHCEAEVTHAGLVLRERPVEVWRSFACAAHKGELRAARELLPRDLEVLAGWRQRRADALAGRGWRSPEPLAVGAEARALVRRAEAAES